jgi:hypothetical protein
VAAYAQVARLYLAGKKTAVLGKTIAIGLDLHHTKLVKLMPLGLGASINSLDICL